ncbi:MAG: c-type cytochrome [Candidatus Anammoxibacter sp.]
MRITNLFVALMLAFFQTTFSFAGEKEEFMGKQLFMRYCAQCHGVRGTGDGVNTKSIVMDPAPKDLCDIEQPYMRKKENGILIEAIKLGGKKDTVTHSLMPYWDKTLSEYEILTLAAFIRTLHKHDQPPVDFSKANKEKPKITVSQININNPTQADIKAGKRIYKENGCIGCHAKRGFGGASGPDMSGVGDRLDAQQIWKIIKYPSSIKPDSKMPAYDINEEDGTLLVAYLLSLKGE